MVSGTKALILGQVGHKTEGCLGYCGYILLWLSTLRKSPSPWPVTTPRWIDITHYAYPPMDESKRTCIRIWVSHFQEMSGQHPKGDNCLREEIGIWNSLEKHLSIWANNLDLSINWLVLSSMPQVLTEGFPCDRCYAGHSLAVGWTAWWVPSPRKTLVLDPECQ